MITQSFCIAFIVSYLGSIPPGTINVSVMQLSILRRHRAAIFLSLAACLVEFIYAGITVQFQLYLNQNPEIAYYLRLVTAIALIGLGAINLLIRSQNEAIQVDEKLKGRHGFLRGLILGFLNPMTIPFWLAITTYLESERWVALDGSGYWFYLLGLTVGTFMLLITINTLGKRFGKIANNQLVVRQIPGMLLLGLGLYYLLKLI
ncbi:MAG: LysE family transporter [Bacteroidota bacterium]